MPAYIKAVTTEIQTLHARHWPNWQAATLYLGGGTPSLVPVDLLECIVKATGITEETEVSLEANPGTVDASKLQSLRRVGVNRLSLGMQSAHAAELSLLGRIHNQRDSVNAFHSARVAGFAVINLDLLYGLPKQRLDSWQETLERALELNPEHLSLYALTVEPRTRLAQWIHEGRIPSPDPDLAADMYELACQTMEAAGFQHYEISNWARPGNECRHNLAYWRNLPYIGIGAGAWGHWPTGQTGCRLRNVSHPATYIDRLARANPPANAPAELPLSAAIDEWEWIPRPLAMAETAFMALRLLKEGLVRTAFEARFGQDPVAYYEKALAQLSHDDLIEWDEQRIRLQPRAVLISNQVFAAFLPDASSEE